mmetsp:Transcript_59103/g.175828  ORF Transcript_59103/g.175828 Transcript_59103/m.175828 type:complete len:203 (-) Transcript_59103:65-673(-)
MSKRCGADDGRRVEVLLRQLLQNLLATEPGGRLLDCPLPCLLLLRRAAAGFHLVGERAQPLHPRALGLERAAHLPQEGRDLASTGPPPDVAVNYDNQNPAKHQEAQHGAQEPQPDDAEGAAHVVHLPVHRVEGVANNEDERAPQCAPDAAEGPYPAAVDQVARQRERRQERRKHDSRICHSPGSPNNGEEHVHARTGSQGPT